MPFPTSRCPRKARHFCISAYAPTPTRPVPSTDHITNVTQERKVINGWCALHGGARGFSNIVIRKVEDGIELDPHTVGACVLTIDEANARTRVETVAE